MASRSFHYLLGYLRRTVHEQTEGESDRDLLDRFVARHDADAFAKLLHRHGPMVLGVCRRILHHDQDAEDAFQATFLVLARKAGGVGYRGTLGGWLQRVAYHVALKARARVLRRQAVEAQVPAAEADDPQPGLAWSELRPVIDETLERLPEKYRAPLVLCCLEGKSKSEAALELGWKEGTVSGRLARAREMMRDRLSRRGLTLAAALFAAGLPAQVQAALPPALEQGTLHLIEMLTAGEAAASASPQVMALVEGVLQSMFVRKLRVAALLALLLVTGAAGVATLALADKPTDPKSTSVTTAEIIPDFPEGPPKMVTQGQQPAPQGGRAVLYSRSRHGNYPLATYSFAAGLRGDDESVANDVELVFGNAQRPDAFKGRRIDAVPGVGGNGACGMDGGADSDQFRVGLHDNADHRIVDLGKIDFQKVTELTKEMEKAADTQAEVKLDHVYVIRLFDRGDARYQKPVYVKLKVLRHRDNDVVMVEWKPLAGLAIQNPGGKGGAGGGAGGAGGQGGAGGAGGVIQLPNLTLEQIQALEKELTAEQKKLFQDLMDVEWRYYQKRAIAQGVTQDELRKQNWAMFSLMSAEERAGYLREMPKQILRFRKEVDPWFVSDEEKAAVAKLPADTAKTVEKLLSDDLDVYLAARRQLLGLGPACIALIAEAGRKLPADSPLQPRLAELMNQLEAQADQEKNIRLLEAATKRLAQLRKEKGEKARVALLVSRMVTRDGLGGHPRHDPRSGWCYYSFPKAAHGYEGAVSLLFDNGGGTGTDFCSNMYGGQQNQIKDLGLVDFATVKSAPKKLDGADYVPAVVGHVYIEHCVEDRGGIDHTFKFRVIELKPREWVVIEWEPIPQEK